MKGFATAWILLFLTLGGRGTQEFTELASERCFYGAALQLFYNPMGERRNVLNTCPLLICSASRPVTQTDTSLWFSIFGIVHEDRVSLEEMSLLIIPLFILLDSEEHMRNFSILSKTSFWFHKTASISLFNRLLPFMAMNQRREMENTHFGHLVYSPCPASWQCRFLPNNMHLSSLSCPVLSFF